MNSYIIALASFLYLLLLFVIAQLSEKSAQKGKSTLANANIYALSLAVYCTAWTYYGSVGEASVSGMHFLSIYIGPTLMAPLMWIFHRKIIRIARVQRLTSVADFIAARFGKSNSLGGLVTLVCLLGIIPYISIQLKAIGTSFQLLMSQTTSPNQAFFIGGYWVDITFFVAVILAIFIMVYGTRSIDTSERHEGMVTAIAFESLIKLIAFLTVGVYITYVLNNGFSDIFAQAAQHPDLANLFTFDANGGYAKWFWLTVLAMPAFILLPRQFQVSVVENVNERHIDRAMWLFPLYLLLINIFVLPIALAGKMLFAGQSVDADTYVLAIPMATNAPWLGLFVYIGGFSAATGMIIVATIAISTMMSNNLIIPYLVNTRPDFNIALYVKPIRRMAIAIVLLVSYAYCRLVAEQYSLVSIGLISFAAVAQFAPALIAALYWKKATRLGAFWGIGTGFTAWLLIFIVPTLISTKLLSTNILTNSIGNMPWLNPSFLFGETGLDSFSQSIFVTILLNTAALVLVSFTTKQHATERNQAEIFVDIFQYSAVYEAAVVWKGTALVPDLQSLLIDFLGEKKAKIALDAFARKHKIDLNASQKADSKLVNYAERLLAGVIGAASARAMVKKVVKEEAVSIQEVYDILKESQQLMLVNKELRRKSIALQQATLALKQTNDKLLQIDELKDEFLYTVTHELRTPLTAIRALAEILADNPSLETEERQHFLETIIKESERLTRLIGQVLDLEKYESGKQTLNLEWCDLLKLLNETVDNLMPLLNEKNIALAVDLDPKLPLAFADRDKITQVLVNLIGNAIKFADPQNPKISISAYFFDQKLKINIVDNGPGLDEAYHQTIFEKFFQAKNQTLRKPTGSGLGLAICKRIVNLHLGQIWVESEPQKGAKFSITLPYYHHSSKPQIFYERK